MFDALIYSLLFDFVSHDKAIVLRLVETRANAVFIMHKAQIDNIINSDKMNLYQKIKMLIALNSTYGLQKVCLDCCEMFHMIPSGAARQDNVLVLRWFLQHVRDIKASKMGRRHVKELFGIDKYGAQWNSNDSSDLDDAMNEFIARSIRDCRSKAIKYSSVNVLKYLFEDHPEYFADHNYVYSAFIDACKYGNLKIAKLLYPKFKILTHAAKRNAIKYGNKNILKWLDKLPRDN